MLTAACFEHSPFISHSAERLDAFANAMLDACASFSSRIYAWCVLPNHYHILLQTDELKPLMTAIGKLHGRTSRMWNVEENLPGRQVWFNCVDREMRSHRHLMASINYVHHNPVKHEYVERWQEWPWTSAVRFLEEMGRDGAEKIWRKFPIKEYGDRWDDL